jgi:adenylosuccinate synthase
MTKAIAVIGANYGDEGKGAVTNWLTKNHKASTVVRFNGGPQAGHTVKIKNGQRHVFRSYSSGSFQGAETHICNTALFNPYEAYLEKQALTKSGYPPPILALDPETEIISPWDIALNQFLELGRGGSKHGSCGMGIGETERRRQTVGAPRLPAVLLKNPIAILGFVKDIRTWFKDRVKAESEAGSFSYLNEEQKAALYAMIEYPAKPISRLYEYCAAMENFEINPLAHVIGKTDTIIFEGAQGLLLDENDPDHQPYTTWSTTGITNVVKVCEQNDIELTDVYYVTRPYLTRHGEGPILAGIICENEWGTDKTNVENEWQGQLRYARLYWDKLVERTMGDFAKMGKFRPNVHLAVTCIDQIESEETYLAFSSDTKRDVQILTEDFVKSIQELTGIHTVSVNGLEG